MDKKTLEYIKQRANQYESSSIQGVSCSDIRLLIAEFEATRASLKMANEAVKYLQGLVYESQVNHATQKDL